VEGASEDCLPKLPRWPCRSTGYTPISGMVREPYAQSQVFSSRVLHFLPTSPTHFCLLLRPYVGQKPERGGASTRSMPRVIPLHGPQLTATAVAVFARIYPQRTARPTGSREKTQTPIGTTVMIIPHHRLSPEALHRVIEAFVTREGTALRSPAESAGGESDV
jgi:hypothetical protein